MQRRAMVIHETCKGGGWCAQRYELMVPAEAEPEGAWRGRFLWRHRSGNVAFGGGDDAVDCCCAFLTMGEIIPKAGPTTAAVIDRSAFARLIDGRMSSPWRRRLWR